MTSVKTVVLAALIGPLILVAAWLPQAHALNERRACYGTTGSRIGQRINISCDRAFGIQDDYYHYGLSKHHKQQGWHCHGSTAAKGGCYTNKGDKSFKWHQ